MKKSVNFIIDNVRYETEYNLRNLRLGNLVYVCFEQNGKPKCFHPSPIKNSIPYCIQWISPPEWGVWLENKIEITNDLKEQIRKVCEKYIAYETIENSLDNMSKNISLKDLYKTSAYLKNKITIVYTVIQRLGLCELLSDPSIGKKLFTHLRPLRIYLYLTCFDRLGQPADWLDFGAWLNSKKHTAERQMAIKNIPGNLRTEQMAQKLYDGYTKIYGVKSSFYRFINEILPSNTRSKLLSSIKIEKSALPLNIDQVPPENENEKLKFLFTTRNKYTHEALYVPGLGESILPDPPIEGWYLYMQETYHNYLRSIYLWNWPSILKECVHEGLSVFMQKESQNNP